MTRLLLFLLITIGCMHPQRPYRFVVFQAPPDSMAVIARTLAAAGHTPAIIDRQLGILHTAWVDTGIRTKIPPSEGTVRPEGTLLLRFTVTVARVAAGDEVILRADSLSCVRKGYAIEKGTEVTGRCEHVEELFAIHQKELEQIGGQLQQALTRSE